ncbi:metallophosphoesterase [Reticulomyxa filosa]|uniref:Metallophosphoesterase n=1 Tax=Reticulomyxa filosa TaxID=46433 RepID=X6NRN5_RETFI|nr:metallophosphoesterase [Reticulomyxa filosa]|eukprot:ETO28686.1 metallophosphoesterase [Reticulomyxa filosa]
MEITDTHNGHNSLTEKLNKLYESENDILIHSGDMTDRGTLQELTEVKNWLKTLKFKHKIVISGNMDGIGLDTNKSSKPVNGKELFKDVATYLEHEEITINGVKIFGSPYTPKFVGGFQLKDAKAAREKWSNIPKDIDVLVVHGPPYGQLDVTSQKRRIGCPELAAVLGLKTDATQTSQTIAPKVVIFGHVHASHGFSKHAATNTTFINAAQYNGIHGSKKSVTPIVYDLDMCSALFGKRSEQKKNKRAKKDKNKGSDEEEEAEEEGEGEEAPKRLFMNTKERALKKNCVCKLYSFFFCVACFFVKV